MQRKGKRRRSTYTNLPFKKPRLVDKYAQTLATLKSRLSPELKYIDTSTSDNMATHAIITLLNGTAEGITSTERIGTQIRMTSVHFQATIQNAIDDAEHDVIRLFVVYDCQTNGALPAYTDIFKTASDVRSVRNLNNRQRFTVLYDSQQMSLPSQAVAAGSYVGVNPVHQFCNRYKKLNMAVMYKGATDAIGDISSGSLLLVVVATTSDAGVTLSTQTRVKFSDA